MPRTKDVQETRISLIESMREETSNPTAWRRFYEVYSPLIIGFALKRGCSQEQAHDVMQETAIALFKHIKSFKYDKRRGQFKSFLFRIAESKVSDIFRRERGSAALHIDSLLNVIAPSDDERAMARSEEIWDKEWEYNVLKRAIADTRRRVKPMTFACFEETYLKGKPVASVAKDLKISGNLVSQHKFKVFKTILETAKTLLNAGDGA